MRGTAVSNGKVAAAHGLTRDQLLRAYRTMVLSRKIDDKEIQLKDQSVIFFQISGAGHEAVVVAAGMHLRPGYDWFFPYYRDRALCLTLGVTPLDMLLSAVGAKDDPSSGGRQMPSHWGDPRLNIVSQSSPTGTQCLARDRLVRGGSSSTSGSPTSKIASPAFHSDEVTYLSVGEGTTSEGEFWESLNAACLGGFRSSTSSRTTGTRSRCPSKCRQRAATSRSSSSSFPGLFVQSIDGTDFVDSYRAMREAIAYARSPERTGFRPRSRHAPVLTLLSDDERLYKTADERSAEAKRDPIVRLATFITSEGLASEGDLESLVKEVEREVTEAADRAIRSEGPTPETADGTSIRRTWTRRRTPSDRCRSGRTAGHDGCRHQSDAQGRNGAQSADCRLR